VGGCSVMDRDYPVSGNVQGIGMNTSRIPLSETSHGNHLDCHRIRSSKSRARAQA
jgi:hypothetical protein